MKIWKFGVIIILCSIATRGFNISIAPNDNINSGKIINMENLYDTASENGVREHATQSADACKCDKGKCVEINGKSICICPPEFGVFKYQGKEECRSCNCGKGANCTINVSFWATTVNCICKEGYKVVNNVCEGPCTKNPCKNGGTCADENKTFKCICPSNYVGKLCETKDPCSSNPCQNGGVCMNSENAFQCYCKMPFTGDKCEIGPCNPNPCNNDGTCHINGKSFNCACKGDFWGETCERDPCTKKPCANDGTCKVEGSSFKCNCKAPYSGKTCEEDPCTTNPCFHDGTCKVEGSSFKCNCKAPYSGKTCEEDPCSNNPCLNGGTCKVYASSFKCNCKAPYIGITCEEDPCHSNPCMNGGFCSADGSAFLCTCMEPYSGRFCENDPCSSNPCLGRGLCSLNGTEIQCFCKEPYSGQFCENDPCSPDPCKNNGSCGWFSTLDGITFLCQCIEPYYGDACEEERHACEVHKPCENDGECFARGRDDYFCECTGGLTGKNCTESTWCLHTGRETCVHVPCVYDSQRNISFCECEHPLLFSVKSKKCEPCYCGDHGICLSEDGMKTCFCNEKYIEKDGICFDPCNPNPCWNFGKCLAANNGSYTCICDKHFTGKICEEQIVLRTFLPTTFIPTTSTHPSCDCGLKSFDCKLDSQGRKRCFCVPGFAQKVDTCSETCSSDDDCLHGGTCQRTNEAFFCVCPNNYFGDFCQVNTACDARKTRCDAMRAVCRITRDGAVCECPPEKAYKWFSGVCEDICDSRKCVNGKCEITGQSFKCICDEGFTGFRCDEKITNKEGLPAYIIGSTLLSVAILLSTLTTLGLVCVLRRYTKVDRAKRDIE